VDHCFRLQHHYTKVCGKDKRSEKPHVESDKVESSWFPDNVLNEIPRNKDDVLNKAIRSVSTEVMSSSLNPATECITTNNMEDNVILLLDVNQNVSETGITELSTGVVPHQEPRSMKCLKITIK
jgi:hypothetical protein